MNSKFSKAEESLDEKFRGILKEAVDKIIQNDTSVQPASAPRLLRVKGKNASSDSVIRLAMAIMRSLSEHNYADLQAIAPPAIARLERAYIKARGILAEYTTDVVLVKVSNFVKVRVNEDGESIDAYDGIRSRVFAVPSYYIPGS